MDIHSDSDTGNSGLKRDFQNVSSKCSSAVTTEAVKRKNAPNPDDIPAKIAHTEEYIFTIKESLEQKEYSVIVSKIPISWNFKYISSFFAQFFVFSKLEVLSDGVSESTKSIQIHFETNEHFLEAKTKLKNDVIKSFGKIMSEEKSDCMPKQEESEQTFCASNISSEFSHTKDADDEVDSSGLYGLKPEYVFSLGIKPPLFQWVHVSNFRTDKSELKEVMELAGNVLVCFIVCSPRRYAKVMYSHPLEAVQAISMLNGQTFYGQVLNVVMIEEDKLTLPKGLNDVGPGLGIAGKPIRDISYQYQRYLNGKSSKIDSKLFRNIENNKFKDVAYDNKFVSEAAQTKTTKTPCHRLKVYNHNSDSDSSLNSDSDLGNIKVSTLNKNNEIHPGSEYCKPIKSVQPCVANQVKPTAIPIRHPVALSYVSKPGPRPHSGNSLPLNPLVQSGPRYNLPTPSTQNFISQSPIIIPDSVTVELRNLPLSTTFPLLCQKLTEVGQIITLQLTAPGCAIVKFANRMQAENCLHRFNNTVAEGNLIEVCFI